MSVQDDQGVVKLEWRFVGNAAAIYAAGRAVESYGRVPSALPRGATIAVGGTTYRVQAQAMTAFPSGPMTFAQLIPPPAAGVAEQPCAAVRAAEFGRVAARLAKLAPSLPTHWTGYAGAVHTYTGALVFVRQGARQLASSGGAGPATIPGSGTVTYEGRAWLVYSFRPSPPARVYLLAPTS
jgi:hypothetical protein